MELKIPNFQENTLQLSTQTLNVWHIDPHVP